MMKILGEGLPRSGAIVVGGAPQDVAVRNTERRALTFQNTSDTEMRLREDGGAATATVGYIVGPGDIVSAMTRQRISVYCAAANKTFEATEL